MGWVTVAAYGIAAILAFAVLYKRSSAQRTFWIVLAVALAFLMINKQLDLQSALTAFARCTAKVQGWYDQRRVLQEGFIIAVASICFVFALGFAYTLRRGLSRIWLALIGFFFLLAFVVIRAAGFHNFDVLIGLQFAGIRMNWVLELSGIVMIVANALFLISQGEEYVPQRRFRRRSRRRSRSRSRSESSDLPFRRDRLRSR